MRRPGASPSRELTASALLLAAYAALAARTTGSPGRHERRSFRVVNSRGDQPLLRLPQQLGTPWVLPGTAAIALVAGRRRLAIAAAVALPLEKAGEVATKKLTRRPRPAQVSEEVDLNDDAPTDGPSYPSGHAAIAWCAVGLVAPHLHPAITAGLAGGAAVSSYARIQQGAHYPLDAVGGALLGLGLAGLLNAATDDAPTRTPALAAG